MLDESILEETWWVKKVTAVSVQLLLVGKSWQIKQNHHVYYCYVRQNRRSFLKSFITVRCIFNEWSLLFNIFKKCASNFCSADILSKYRSLKRKPSQPSFLFFFLFCYKSRHAFVLTTFEYQTEEEVKGQFYVGSRFKYLEVFSYSEPPERCWLMGIYSYINKDRRLCHIK